MIFHENRLLAEDSHEIPYLIFLKIKKYVAKFVVCFSPDWRLKKNESYDIFEKKIETIFCILILF